MCVYVSYFFLIKSLNYNISVHERYIKINKDKFKKDLQVILHKSIFYYTSCENRSHRFFGSMRFCFGSIHASIHFEDLRIILNPLLPKEAEGFLEDLQ